MQAKLIATLCGVAAATGIHFTAYSQAAGAGAQYNKQDRTASEHQRLKNYDKPAYKDPVGNAVIGGGVSGALKGSVSAGMSSVATGTATNIAKKKTADALRAKAHKDKPPAKSQAGDTF